MAADNDECAGHFAANSLGQSNRPVPLRREIALKSDNVRIERATQREAVLFAVDPQIEDGALVAVLLDAGRDADRPQRLDKREHLQAKDAAHSIPGFGGLLDVVDSVLFAAPVPGPTY